MNDNGNPLSPKPGCRLRIDFIASNKDGGVWAYAAVGCHTVAAFGPDRGIAAAELLAGLALEKDEQQ